MTDGFSFSPDPNKSKSIYFLEESTRFLPQSVQFSGSEETSFFNVLRRLQTILDGQFNENEMGQLVAELYTISSNSPNAWKLLEHLVEKLQPTEQIVSQTHSGASEFQSKPTISSSALAGYVEKQFPMKDWYVEVDYVPDQYNAQEAKLYVTLTDEPSNHSSGNFKLQSLGRPERIAVVIDGLLPNFDPLGSNREERSLVPQEHRTTFDFKLRPRLTYGSAIVIANVFLPDSQENPIASAKKVIRLSPYALDLIMRVWKEGNRLYFSVRFGADLSDRDVGNKQLDSDPKEYFERVHKYLNKLASNPDDIDANLVRKQLEEIGMQLYSDLFPDSLKQLYWDLIHGRVLTWQLLLDSDSSQIPWELLVPISYERNKTQSEYHFLCEEYQLGRWMARKGEGVAYLPQWINISPLALLSYDPAQLDGIAKEKNLLEGLSELKVNPVQPNHEDLESFLGSDIMKGCFGLHLSGDGKYDDGVKGCLFQLEDDPLTEINLLRPENRAFGRIGPFVFLNFCESGQVGHSLTGIRGWATQFMEIGASCMVATMWKANDESAPNFSCALYEQLLNGVSIGEAMQLARKHIKNRGDATWLCYILYGDPRAKVGPTKLQPIKELGDNFNG
jgi:CHAT domain